MTHTASVERRRHFRSRIRNDGLDLVFRFRNPCARMYFQVVGLSASQETIAYGSGIREIRRLRRRHGEGRWRKRQERRQQMRAMRAMAAAGGPLLAPPRAPDRGRFRRALPADRFQRFAGDDSARARSSASAISRATTASATTARCSISINDNSIGRCRYTNIVAPYYRAQHPKTYYTDRNDPAAAARHRVDQRGAGASQGQRLRLLAADRRQPGLRLRDERLLRRAGHQQLGRGAVAALPPPGQLRCRSRRAGRRSTTSSPRWAPSLTLGTFCHENGHMLCDYPDLYDYGYESSGVGAFCLMCAGNNVSEKNPIQISAYLKRLSGWARTVTPLEHGAQVTLDAGSNDFAIYSRGGREYFLIENRAQGRPRCRAARRGAGDLACRRRRRQQPRADDQRQPLRTVAGTGGRVVPARAAARPDRRCATTCSPGQRARFADDTTPTASGGTALRRT